MDAIRLKAESNHSDVLTVISRTLEVAKNSKIDITLQIGQIELRVRQDSNCFDLHEIYNLKLKLLGSKS